MDKEAQLQGTRDNVMQKLNATFWIYEFLRCDNSYRARIKLDPTCVETDDNKCEHIDHRDENGELIDPECASEKEIDEWLFGKTLGGRLLNPQIDFGWDQPSIRESEMWLPRFDLKNG